MSRIVFAACGVVVVGAFLIAASPRDGQPSSDDHQRQVEAMVALCRIGQAVEEFSIDHDRYPQVSSIRGLTSKVVPRYVDQLPETDSWGNEFFIHSTPIGYTIASCGKDAHGGCTPAMVNQGGESADPRMDIILSNGVFYQWPDGVFEALDGGNPGCRHLKDQEHGHVVAHEEDDAR